MPGLRERNKARTRAEIKARALDLIAANGYAATTVEAIAKAADVSPSTFFRYFQTKEDAVLADDYDEVMVQAFRRQPAGLSPLEAFRETLREIFGALAGAERESEQRRIRIVLGVPELRDRMLGALAENVTLLSDLVAERAGRKADDRRVQHYAGAIVGVAITAMFRSAADPTLDPLVAIDEALSDLADGLPL
ncbi:MAG TPA: TetR family transcriptional regulator [Micromonosporaceae bacterium]